MKKHTYKTEVAKGGKLLIERADGRKEVMTPELFEAMAADLERGKRFKRRTESRPGKMTFWVERNGKEVEISSREYDDLYQAAKMGGAEEAVLHIKYAP